MRETVSVPIGVTSGAWVVADPSERLRAIETWTVLADFASVNFHERGATQVAGVARSRRRSRSRCPDAAAELLVVSGLADRCHLEGDRRLGREAPVY